LPKIVFISYSHSQSSVVDRLKRDLRQAGIQVWIDHENLEPGTPSWEQAIRTGIQASDIVLYMASPEALISNNVQGEIDVAQALHKLIIPLWIAGTEWVHAAPMAMSKAQYLDARGIAYATAVARLLERLGVPPQQSENYAPPIVAKSPVSPVPQPHAPQQAMASYSVTYPSSPSRTSPAKTIHAPRVHPLLIGGSFGLITGILNYGTDLLNHKVLNSANGWLGFLGTVLLPLIAVYLSGHYAGRYQRLNLAANPMVSAVRSVFSGTASGLTTGVLYVVMSLLTQRLDSIFGLSGSTNAYGASLSVLADIGGVIIWLVLGLLGGTIGGYFGDHLANQQIKKGAAVASR
jgi:hypothetical protein